MYYPSLPRIKCDGKKGPGCSLEEIGYLSTAPDARMDGCAACQLVERTGYIGITT